MFKFSNLITSFFLKKTRSTQSYTKKYPEKNAILMKIWLSINKKSIFVKKIFY